MDWQEAVEVVIERSPGPHKHTRWRELCAEDHPDHAIHRARVVALATGESPPADYPSLATMATNLAGAVGRLVRTAAKGEALLVPADVLAERRRICGECPQFDRQRGRCRLCGCGGAKLHLATEICPDKPPRWGPWEKPENEIHQ